MSYSISVPFKDAASQAYMKEFLLANSGIIKRLVQTNTLYQIYDYSILKDSELGYAPSKENHLLGFQGSELPKYLWDLCAWMAVKTQPRRKNKFFYHDSAKVKIVVNDTTPTQHMCVDEQGLPLQKEPNLAIPVEIQALLSSMDPNPQDRRAIINELNIVWEKIELEKKIGPVKAVSLGVQPQSSKHKI